MADKGRVSDLSGASFVPSLVSLKSTWLLNSDSFFYLDICLAILDQDDSLRALTKVLSSFSCLSCFYEVSILARASYKDGFLFEQDPSVIRTMTFAFYPNCSKFLG